MSEFSTSPEFERKMQELAARTPHMFIPRSGATRSMSEMRFSGDPADAHEDEGRRVIPEAAIEAAAKAYRAKVEWIDRHSRDDYGREDELGIRAALEAAAPHILAEAWELGAQVAWSRSTPEVNGTAYKWRHDGEPLNPYGASK